MGRPRPFKRRAPTSDVSYINKDPTQLINDPWRWGGGALELYIYSLVPMCQRANFCHKSWHVDTSRQDYKYTVLTHPHPTSKGHLLAALDLY